jgi:hypothetical protein
MKGSIIIVIIVVCAITLTCSPHCYAHKEYRYLMIHPAVHTRNIRKIENTITNKKLSMYCREQIRINHGKLLIRYIV